MSERVPEGWSETSIEELLSPECLFSDGDWVESKDQDQKGNNRLIQLADIGDGSFRDRSHRFMNDEQFNRLKCTELKKGDILVARMPDPIGRAAIFPKIKHRSATVVDIAILRPTKIDSYWLMSIINSTEFRKEIEENATGTTRTRIGRISLSKIKIKSPPLPEQKKIASILTSVDEVIETTQKQIDKLQDLKKATMNELLTKGIGHTEFKDSELGRIPKSWEVGLVGDYSSLVTNGFVGSAVQHYRSEGIPYLVSKNIRDNFIDERGLTYITKEFHEKTAKSNLKIGDLLTVQSGHVGSSAVVSKKFNGANCHALILTRFYHDLINSDFVAYYLNSQIGRLRLSDYFVGSTIVHLNTSDLKKFRFPIPNLSEQCEIVTIVKSIEQQISFWTTKLSQTQSLKKSLMQDLLTGKVRVQVH